jgi:putative membrane protein
MPTPARTDDKKFLKEAAMSGQAEVQLGQMAEQKASSEAVKEFARRMVADHTKANEQLKQVASRANVEVPDQVKGKEEATIKKLDKLSGADFDKAYIKDQLKDHKQAVNEFKSEAENGTIPAVKEFASQTLPTLEQHLELAKNLNKSGTATATK